MPIYRRLPKRGFNPINKQAYKIINLYQINYLIKNQKLTQDIKLEDIEKLGLFLFWKLSILNALDYLFAVCVLRINRLTYKCFLCFEIFSNLNLHFSLSVLLNRLQLGSNLHFTGILTLLNLKWVNLLNFIDHSDPEIRWITQAMKSIHPFQNIQRSFCDFRHVRRYYFASYSTYMSNFGDL